MAAGDIFYATTRNDKGGKYGHEKAAMTYGTCDGTGNSIRQMSLMDLKNSLQESRNVIVFAHGFNTSFREGAEQFTELLDGGLRLEAPPGCAFVLISWNSRGKAFKKRIKFRSYYGTDKKKMKVATSAVGKFLVELAHLRPGNVHVVGHSMGARLVFRSLHAALRQDHSCRFGHVAFVAGDVGKNNLQKHYASRLKPGTGTQTCLNYLCKEDKALKASKVVNGFHHRIGQSSVKVKGAHKLVNIRISSAMARSAGGSRRHTYLGLEALARDIGQAFRGLAPGSRNLRARGHGKGWRLNPTPTRRAVVLRRGRLAAAALRNWESGDTDVDAASPARSSATSGSEASRGASVDGGASSASA